MKKLILAMLMLLFSLPVFAGVYEDALRTGCPVCLYIGTNHCKYCKQADPVFEKLMRNYKKTYQFVKVDAESPYGNLLMQNLMAGYVPFLVLADAKRQYFVPITPICAIEYACIEKEMKNFLK